MFFFLPSCPYKIQIIKIFLSSLLPPVPLFKHILNDSWIVACTNPKLLARCYSLVSRRNLVKLWICCLSIIRNLFLVLIKMVCLEDSIVKCVVHLYFQCQNEIPRIKKFSKRMFTVKFLWNLYVKHFYKFREVLESFVFSS